MHSLRSWYVLGHSRGVNQRYLHGLRSRDVLWDSRQLHLHNLWSWNVRWNSRGDSLYTLLGWELLWLNGGFLQRSLCCLQSRDVLWHLRGGIHLDLHGLQFRDVLWNSRGDSLYSLLGWELLWLNRGVLQRSVCFVFGGNVLERWKFDLHCMPCWDLLAGRGV